MLAAAAMALSTQAHARDIQVEFLQANITPSNVKLLDGIWCRNVDKVLHVKLAVDWPQDAMNRETTGYKRLIFWTKEVEYLFPPDSYNFQHGVYIVNGYFIARAGGTHQGVSSFSFERVPDATVLLNPAVKEVQMQKPGCSVS
jgi:hypothetical protein